MFLKNLSYQSRREIFSSSNSDEELIQAFRQNQENYIIGILFDRYIHLVFASCMKYYKNENDSQDAAMEIFESLADKLLKYEVEFFKSWLYTTTRNHCLMQLRKKKVLDNVENFEKIVELSVENAGELNLINGEDEKDVLQKLVGELKDEQRICIEFMYFQGLSYKAITDKTGFELKHVKSFIQNGKRNLKQKLEQFYEQQSRK